MIQITTPYSLQELHALNVNPDSPPLIPKSAGMVFSNVCDDLSMTAERCKPKHSDDVPPDKENQYRNFYLRKVTLFIGLRIVLKGSNLKYGIKQLASFDSLLKGAL